MKLTKKEQELLNDLDTTGPSEVIQNPYSGRSVELDGTGVALYDFIKAAGAFGLHNDTILAKTAFAKLYPNEYMILID